MKSYFKFLSRNKLYTFIEVIGLTLSLAFVILSGTYVWQQYDVIYGTPDSERICLLGRDGYLSLSDNEKLIFNSNPVPEIEKMARYARFSISLEVENEQWLRRKVTYVDKEWFEIFSNLEFEAGSPEAFDDLNNVFVSRSFANALGGDVIGRTVIDLDRKREYVIAGIMKDFTGSFFLDTDIIINNRVLSPDNSKLDYRNLDHHTYNFIKLAEGTDFEEAQAKIKKVLESAAPVYFNDYFYKARLYTLKDAFYSKRNMNYFRSADAEYIYILLIMVAALLVSAIFNYINLSFALITKRAKEVATRRLVGASRLDILFKCIGESVLFTTGCFALALMVAIAFEPVMNQLLMLHSMESSIPIDISLSFKYLASYIGLAFVLGVIVGIIPAFSMSSFEPIDVVKGVFRTKSKMVFSRCFIVVQNALAVILIAMGILMEVQLNYMENLPVNCNTDNIIYMMSDEHPALRTNPEKVHALYDALMENPYVKRVAYGSDGFPRYITGQYRSYITLFYDDGSQRRPFMLFCDSLYFDMLDLEIVEERHTPLHRSVWLSESLTKVFPLNDSTEKAMFAYQKHTDHVGGVYKDIPTHNNKYEYSAIEVLPRKEIREPSLIIETYDESEEALESVRAMCEDLLKDNSIHFEVREHFWINFISSRYELMMAKTVSFIRLVEIFMLLAVLLSLMGLVAMSIYFSEQRSKDIAIRKVFGGTILTETIASVRSYVIMLLAAAIIGVPVAVYLSGLYLEQFPNRIENCWWIYLLAVLISFAISVSSVLWQTIKAARINPAMELKKD